MLELGLTVLLSYLLGSLNGSLVLGSLAGGPDIRTVGSGNPGLTNALRARGGWFALWVMAIDMGKGFLATALLPGLELPASPTEVGVTRTWLTLACAGAVVVGHCYPLWFQFAGGKGAATAAGALLAISPELLLPGTVAWLLVLTTTGFVGLATITAATVLPVYVALTGLPERAELFSFLVLLAVFILYTHRSNVRRMLRREENRMPGAMLLRRSR
jgi:glycerol-3-phosphate acyltransferase PlsY